MRPLTSAGVRAGVFGAAAGLVTVGAAAGFAAERLAVRRLRSRPDPAAEEPFGRLRGPVTEVRAGDGTRLHVEVDEPARRRWGAGPPLTVVFTHGYALSMDCFHYQRRDLRDLGRLVFWDLRSHGRSGRGHRDTATIPQLGRDLGCVLDAVAPTGPLVLVAHSMGGMALLALAEQQPELFADRVVGVALISTSAGGLAEVDLGIPLLRLRLARGLRAGAVAALARQHALVERARHLGRDAAFLLTRHYSYASDVPASLVDFTAAMIASTPFDVLAEFYPAFETHERYAALRALDGLETLVLVGAQDLLTPPEHSRAIVAALPGAELVVVPQARHLVMLEHPDVVNGHLRDLVARATRAGRARRGAPSRRRA